MKPMSSAPPVHLDGLRHNVSAFSSSSSASETTKISKRNIAPANTDVCSGSNSNSGTRVWVKASAIDSVQVPKLTFKEKMAKNRTVSSSNGAVNQMHHSFSTASVTSFTSARDLSDTDSDLGSFGFASANTSRNQPWGWKCGYMIESTSTSNKQAVGGNSDVGTGDNLIVRLEQVGPSNSSSGTISIPSTALNDGDVVLANEYSINKEGIPVCPDDLISLTHLHEPAVVECLQRRYMEDSIYTNTGPVLLALNPFQSLRGLYTEATMKKYWDKAERQTKDSLPPHVYAIADNSFRNMIRQLDGDFEEGSCNQSILVSGESGAGKTVTAKFVMKYLAALSQRAASNSQPDQRAYIRAAENRNSLQHSRRLKRSLSSSKFSAPSWAMDSVNQHNDSRDSLASATILSDSASSTSIEAQVLQSNPILESFGNARTVRNDNSSRFGKFIEIQFTETGRLVGAQVEVYLLEKVRLVTQAVGERNYHIFYEMLSGGMDSSELRKFFIASTATPEDFRITASGTYDRQDGVADKDTYRALRTAMSTMEFEVEEQRDVFAITAAILHASNLTFCDLDQESALDRENVHLEPVCRLFGVAADELDKSLCYYSITAGKDRHVLRSRNADKAEKGLEAFLKVTYGALFLHLVKRINDLIACKDYVLNEKGERKSIDTKSKPKACIGVLDIFGFESFTTNSFEQLCINYCNEALQQQFNAFVLKNEQADYEREGIDWSFIEFPENQDVLDLIEKRGTGLLSVLDDQCRAPGTSDKSFAHAVYTQCKSQSRFSASRKQKAVLQFSVHHYAGRVEYDAEGFVEKNRDELPREAIELLQNSSNSFVRLLASIIEESQKPPQPSKGVLVGSRDAPVNLRRGDSSMSRATVGGHFRRQLRVLRNKIDNMSPHYIRCLKPNDDLVPDHFDPTAIAEQLRCGGILEAVRVARAGFSNHYSHESFLRRYRCLGWKELKLKSTYASNFGGWTNSPSPKRTLDPSRGGGFHNLPSISSPKTTKKSSNLEPECRELIKVVYRKIQQSGMGDSTPHTSSNTSSNQSGAPSTVSHIAPKTPPAVRCRSSTIQPSTPPASWSRPAKTPPTKHGLPPVPSTAPAKSRMHAPWEKKSCLGAPQPPLSPSVPSFRSSIRRGGTSAEWAKMGIQIGKTKVFLRHKVFEVLERIRGNEHALAAIKLNSIFRMYLARAAYVEVLNQVRQSFAKMKTLGNEIKETKEQEYEDMPPASVKVFNFEAVVRNGQAPSLVDQFATQVRNKIHNPVPRNEWGKEASNKPYKWRIVDGLWTKTEI